MDTKTQSSQIVRGCFEQISLIDRHFEVSGWILSLDQAIEELVLQIDGKTLSKIEIQKRYDVGKVFPSIQHSSNSGFKISVEVEEDTFNKLTPISIKAYTDDKLIGQMKTSFSKDAKTNFPLPPEHLRYRITRNKSANYYIMSSLHSFNDYWSNIKRFGNTCTIKKMLDWGGGSGRMHPFFFKFTTIPEIHACDIDPEAIEWANKNIPQVKYSLIPPYPPTEYPNEYFDLIISYSVCTHLTEDVQLSWIKEMHRILKPNGLFLTTTHGSFAMRWSFPPTTIDMIESKGFFDDPKDDVLDGISPADYYRATFQTKSYTKDKWSPYFEILDYKEAGALNYQDLITMKKK
jgi:SAM-dependent methyltransferase